MAVTTLTCSGTRKQYGLKCYSVAVWAIKGPDGYWHGACHHHPHQVLKRLGAKGAALTVQLATEAMKENERLRNLPGTLTRAEELVDVLRPIVLNGEPCKGDPWTAERVATILSNEGHQATGEEAREVLELLCEEKIMEHWGDGSYDCIAHLPG